MWFLLLGWVGPWTGSELSLEKIRPDLIHLAGMKCKQSEAEVRLNNLELKAGLIPQLKKILNTLRGRPMGKLRKLSPSVQTKVPMSCCIWTVSEVPRWAALFTVNGLAIRKPRSWEEARESFYSPEVRITPPAEILIGLIYGRPRNLWATLWKTVD